MSRVLLIYSHPAPHKSRINSELVRAAAALPFVSVHDLYEIYPDFNIDIAAEQERLQSHDYLVFQHPLYWYSCPALMKEWMDLVLCYGYAYGGDSAMALRGKQWLSVVTAGGAQASYGDEGYNRYPLHHLLRPFEQTATLCGMNFHPPLAFYGTHKLTDQQLEESAVRYQQRLCELINPSLAALISHR